MQRCFCHKCDKPIVGSDIVYSLMEVLEDDSVRFTCLNCMSTDQIKEHYNEIYSIMQAVDMLDNDNIKEAKGLFELFLDASRIF